jgi:hypothetical protein
MFGGWPACRTGTIENQVTSYNDVTLLDDRHTTTVQKALLKLGNNLEERESSRLWKVDQEVESMKN